MHSSSLNGPVYMINNARAMCIDSEADFKIYVLPVPPKLAET